MTVGGDVSWTLGLYELSKAAALAAGCEIFVRGVETEERLETLAREARRAAAAFERLAELADQQAVALAAVHEDDATEWWRDEGGATTAETICGLLALALILAFVLVLLRGWP